MLEDSERGCGGLMAPRLGLRLALFLKVTGGREPGRRRQPEWALMSLCCWCRVDGPAGEGGGSWWGREEAPGGEGEGSYGSHGAKREQKC